jgi:phosphoribosylformylglycinamidine synthase
MIANGKVPELNLERELAVQKACLEAAEAGLLTSAHDCADGGLAVALAESCFSSLGKDAIGTGVDLTGTLDTTALLFSESPSRIIITFDREAVEAIRQIAESNNAPLAILGNIGGPELKISVDGTQVLTAPVADLESTWRSALSNSLKAEALVAG